MSENFRSISYAGRDVPLIYRADCLVIGGGVSGVAAAISAAKNGSRTLLIERGITLGGLQTLGLVVPMMPTYAPMSDTPFVREVKERLALCGIDHDDKVTGTCWTNPEVLAQIYDDLTEEAGAEVLYNAVLVDVIKDGAKISGAIVLTVSGLCFIEAKVFVDATGDALLARIFGIPFECGSEKSGLNQPMSFRFEIGGIDLKRLYVHVSLELGDDWCKSKLPHYEIAEAMNRQTRYVLEEFMQKGVDAGELTKEDAEYMQGFTVIGKDGVMAMNCPELSREFKPTEPFSYSAGVREGRKMMRRIAAYLKKNMPGFENSYIAREATLLGARESWRIRGKYYLTEDDYYGERKFADGVARTAWYIDAHGERVEPRLREGAYYEIPYRSLVTNECENLIVCGRSISASFAVQASLRIQPTCMSMGEAAGIAAAWCVKNEVNANALDWGALPKSVRSYVSEGNIY